MSFDNKFSRFELQRIAIIYSHLDRPTPFYNQKGKLSLDIGINPDYKEDEEKLLVSIKLNSEENVVEDEKLRIEIHAVGVFNILEVSDEEKEAEINYFINVNAPAIIYPYIRQHVTYLSLQAGTLNPIILPIVNFVQLYEQNKEKEGGEE